MLYQYVYVKMQFILAHHVIWPSGVTVRVFDLWFRGLWQYRDSKKTTIKLYIQLCNSVVKLWPWCINHLKALCACDTLPKLRQTYSYLPSHIASLPCDCVNYLLKAVAWKKAQRRTQNLRVISAMPSQLRHQVTQSLAAGFKA